MSSRTPHRARSESSENAGLGRPDPGLEAVLTRVEQSIASERGVRAWLRSRSTSSRVVSMCALVAVLALSHLAWARRADWAVYPAGRLVLIAAVHALAVVYSIRVFLAPLTEPQRPGRASWVAGLLLLPVFAALLPELHTTPADQLETSASVRAAASCFFYGGLVVVSVCAVLWCADRGGRAWLVGALPAVVGAGLSAYLVLQLHCANDNRVHLLLGHASIGFAWLVLLLGLRALGLAFQRSK